MAKKTPPKQYNVPTTNFIIHLDKIKVEALQEKYQLFTIEVPDSFGYSKDPNKFPKLHNAYKEELEFPYYFYFYAKPKPTIYILVEKSKQPINPISLDLEFLNGKKVTAIKMDIAELCTQENLHILAKLFLSNYFYKHKKTYRICQGKFYLHSKIESKWATALEISGLKHTKNTEEFCFGPKATFMVEVDKSKENKQFISSNLYCELVGGEIYYRQLKTSYVAQLLAKPQDPEIIWKVVTGSVTNKPSIKWFEDYENITRCKSTLLQNVQEKLLKHYNACFGADVAIQQSHFMTKIKPIDLPKPEDNAGLFSGYSNFGFGKGTGLFLKILDKIGVLDLRQKKVSNPNQNNFQDYIAFLNKYYGKLYDVCFLEIKQEDLETTKKPVFVLQDVEKQLFEEGGFLITYDDPKKELYEKFADKIPLQTMNINFNKAEGFDSADVYFEYEVLGKCLIPFGNSILEISENLKEEKDKIQNLYEEEKEKFVTVSESAKEKRKINENLKNYFSLITNKIDVCLNELLLKKYIIDKLPIKNLDLPNHCLPCIFKTPSLTNYAYMYQNILMYIDDDFVLQFLDLDEPSGKKERNNFLNNWNIEWHTFENDFAKHNDTRDENGNDKQNKTENGIKNTHLVFSKGLVLAIEDTEERVFHIYDPNKKGESQRKGEQKTAMEGIFFSKEKQLYTVGYKSLNKTADDSVKIRKLHYYQKPADFKIDGLLQTLSVEFVRYKQYTVYPYFFDLLNLYREDILQK